jgi:hypothetical protein
MTNTINISASGGTVSVGNAVQGDRNNVNAPVSPAVERSKVPPAVRSGKSLAGTKVFIGHGRSLVWRN